MDHPDEFSGDRRRDGQNQRPPPLKVSKDSHKIKKPPIPPPPPPPLIIYEVPPVVHHVPPHEFMGVVQRLTGPPEQPPATRIPSGPGSSSTAPAMHPPPASERTMMPPEGYNYSNTLITSDQNSRPGSIIHQGGFPPGPGSSVFQYPVQEPSPFISQVLYHQQYHPDMEGGSSSSTSGFISQLPSPTGSNDFINSLSIYFPQQEDDHDHDLDNDNR